MQVGNAYEQPPSAHAIAEAKLGYRSFGDKERLEENETLKQNLLEISRKFLLETKEN